MAVDIQRELESQLQAVNDKLASLGELTEQKNRLEATLALLRGEISLDNFRPKTAGKKAAAGGTGRTMSELHRARIKLAHLRKKLEESPRDKALKEKVDTLTALIASLDK